MAANARSAATSESRAAFARAGAGREGRATIAMHPIHNRRFIETLQGCAGGGMPAPEYMVEGCRASGPWEVDVLVPAGVHGAARVFAHGLKMASWADETAGRTHHAGAGDRDRSTPGRGLHLRRRL